MEWLKLDLGHFLIWSHLRASMLRVEADRGVGIQYFWLLRCFWIPASAGMTVIFVPRSHAPAWERDQSSMIGIAETVTFRLLGYGIYDIKRVI